MLLYFFLLLINEELISLQNLSHIFKFWSTSGYDVTFVISNRYEIFEVSFKSVLHINKFPSTAFCVQIFVFKIL